MNKSPSPIEKLKNAFDFVRNMTEKSVREPLPALQVDLITLKMARKPVKIQRKVQQDALGKVNRVKENRRRGKDVLKINRQRHYVRKKVS